MKKGILFLLLIVCCTVNSKAQFLERLSKKAMRAAERTVERKVEQKAAKETGKAFDSAFEQRAKENTKAGTKGMSSMGMSKVQPAETYRFDHKVVMQIKSNKDVMDIDYFLPDNKNYLGVLIKGKSMKENFYTVMDSDREAIYTFIDNEDQKMKMGINFPMEEADVKEAKFEILATGNTKTIYGYQCLEYKLTGEKVNGLMWVTKDVDIRFPNYYQNTNKDFSQEWLKDLDGWAMKVEMVDETNRKPQTIIMECLSIDKTDLVIHTHDYKSIQY